MVGGIGFSFAQPPRFAVVDSTLYRGAAPETPAEFAFLKRIGIKTILSVDRAKPDRAAAESLGMRYLQIPIGYDKIPRKAALDMLKAMRVPGIQGPFYIHCHAGKFRVGAMSACYRIAVNHWPPDSALAEMVRLGGSDKYKGLNKSILDFVPPTEMELARDAFDPDKPPEPAPFAERMSGIDRLFDELKKFSADTAEMKGSVLALEESFAEIHRLKLCKACDSTAYADMLEMSYGFQSMRKAIDFSRQKIKEAENSCNRCHERIRN